MVRRAGSTATMHDVAARAGVSIKTVSNVVNGYPFIRPATRERVEQAIAELGYHVNTSARSLRRGRTGVIGLALPELSLPYFAELADAVIDAADERGVTVLIERTGAARERELSVLTGERRRLTDGLIFSPLALGPEDAGVLPGGYPLVLLGERIFGAPCDHVTMDNVAASRAATRHLASLGRRRIAVIGASPGEATGTAALRVEGYRAALAEAGLPYDPSLVREAGGPWHRSTGAQAMARLLDEGVAVDAVFGLNDALALGALHVLHGRGVPVPEQIAVIGFDGIEETAYSAPTLSTVDAGRLQIARTAVGLLLDRIDGTAGPGAFRQVVADYQLVVRESTSER